MYTEHHTFDVDGDLLLLLTRTDDESDPPSAKKKLHPLDRPDDESLEEGDINVRTEILDTEILDESSSESHTDEAKPQTEVRMLVSSKHMMLASPVFKAMLQRSTFKEGKELNVSGKVEVPLPDDESTALEIILNIIHGRNRRVPKKVSFNTLTNIAILVDKYQMVETVEAYSDYWISWLRKDMPEDFNCEREVEIYQWIMISWVFWKSDSNGDKDSNKNSNNNNDNNSDSDSNKSSDSVADEDDENDFTKMTRLVEKNCEHNLRERIPVDLPIPDIVIDTIMQKREDAMFDCYALIQNIIRLYRTPPPFSPEIDGIKMRVLRNTYHKLEMCEGMGGSACDAMVLGSLLREATRLGLYPKPRLPYIEKSFVELKKDIRRLEIMSLCEKSWKPQKRLDIHGVKGLIGGQLCKLERHLQGLNLNDFKNKKPEA